MTSSTDDSRAAGHVADLEREVASLRSQRDAAWAQLETMRHSLSWRLTAPLRRLARLVVRLRAR